MSVAQSQPSVGALTVLLHLTGWAVLLCVIFFIGLKYRDILRPRVNFPQTPRELRPRRQRRIRSTRAPNPSPARPGLVSGPVPLGLVTTALSTETSVSIHELPSERPRYILRWPRTRRRISIGAVEEGRIAQRRQASQSLYI